MSEYIPKKYPVYTVDSQGRLYEYWGADAWQLLRTADERRIWKKDLPKNYVIYREWHDIDV